MKTILLLLISISAYGQKYRVTAVSADGKDSSRSNTVRPAPTARMYVPGAFTPNGDGVNDKFAVKATNVVEFEMSIYSRGGGLLWTTTDPNGAWDGGNCMSGVYAVRIEWSEADGRNFYRLREVVLVR